MLKCQTVENIFKFFNKLFLVSVKDTWVKLNNNLDKKTTHPVELYITKYLWLFKSRNDNKVYILVAQ